MASKHKRQRSTGSVLNLGGGSITSLFQKTLNPRHHLRGRIVKKAATVVDNYVTELTSKAPYLLSCDAVSSGLEGEGAPNTNPTSATTRTTIPLLDRDELRVGKLLGEGGFCQVWDVKGIALRTTSTTTSNSTDDKAQEEARQQLASINQPALAVKQLRKRLVKSPPKFTLAAADLVVEAQYLSRLAHPHIVPVRAMTRGHLASMQEDGRYDAYFIVLDKLEVTLDRRIQNWQRGFENMPSYGTKLTWCWQIASALQYLHERRILFRDVKPQNIGFRADTQQLQLFDFGLCRELPPPRQRVVREEEAEEDLKGEKGGEEGSCFNDASTEEFNRHASTSPQDEQEEEEDDDDIDYDDYYHMTKVGTRRYSAVEMHISGRYNEKIDVYSWAMTVYEMISLCKPFASLSDADHQEYVCAQGKRPNTKAFLQQCEQPREGQAQPLLTLIRQAWEQYVRYRIDIHTVVETMETIIQERHEHGCRSPAASPITTGSTTNNLDKSMEVAGSVVSATTALTESDHDETLNGNSGSVGPIPPPPHLAGNSSSNNNVSFRLKKEDEETDEDAGSIQSLIVVNMMGSSNASGVASSRHSLMSTRSIETASSSGSTGWDDSINTFDGGVAVDASLSNIVFDELLQNRRRASEWSAESSPVSTLGSPVGETPSNKSSSVNTRAKLTSAATAALTQPSLMHHNPLTIGNAGDILPPALGRIASDMAQDEDDEENMTPHWTPLNPREALSS